MARDSSPRRRASKGTDPALQSYTWIKKIRPYWVARRLPCARCGGDIDYVSSRYYPNTRRVNPATLVVGHIVGRDEARARGWPEDRINARENTQPEHARCSDRSGALYLQAKRAGLITLAAPGRPETDVSRKW